MLMAVKRGETRLNWIIEFEINDKDKWEEGIKFYRK